MEITNLFSKENSCRLLVNLEGLGQEIAVNPFEVVDGYISIPDSPGLGIELDEQALARHSYQLFPIRPALQYYEEGP